MSPDSSGGRGGGEAMDRSGDPPGESGAGAQADPEPQKVERYRVAEPSGFADRLRESLAATGFEVTSDGLDDVPGRLRAVLRSRVPDDLVAAVPSLVDLGLGSEVTVDVELRVETREAVFRVASRRARTGAASGATAAEGGGDAARAARRLARVTARLLEEGTLSSIRD